MKRYFHPQSNARLVEKMEGRGNSKTGPSKTKKKMGTLVGVPSAKGWVGGTLGDSTERILRKKPEVTG